VERHIKHLCRDASVNRFLKAGQNAPRFVLTDQHGNSVRSTDILARGPLIVSFFRRSWCPYCNEELAALTEAYAEIRKAGAEVVAVTSPSAANGGRCCSAHHIPFPILVDADSSVQVSFGVTFEVPDYLRECYKTSFPGDLIPGKAGNPWRLAIPARFVIGTGGTIIDACADADYRLDEAAVPTLTLLDGISSSITRDDAQWDADERQRRFGNFLRQRRLAIPVATKTLGTFVRLPNRVGKAVSQEELAEAINVSRSWYGLLETGRQVQPSAALLDRICDALMLHERQRLTLFELGLPAFTRRAVEFGRRVVVDASAGIRRLNSRAS
jgi:peroxiredoxin/transcriptional regulator with XRE-family HTH domain